MNAIKLILKITVIIVAVLIIAGLVLISRIKNGAVPDYDGETILSGLGSEVTVFRDERGMPHIYASNEHDLYFTVGYVMAQERLWQMDLIRRATTGRLSEIFGEDYVQTDLFLRCLEMTAKSKQVLSNTDPEILSSIQAYADGVNAYIENAGRKLPPEFIILSYRPDPWKLEDIANIIGYMGWDLASDNLESDIFYYRLVNRIGEEKASLLIPDFKSGGSEVFPGFSLDDKLLRNATEFLSSLDRLKSLGIVSFSGSNNWAVSGKKSETGAPLLSNDMHLGLSSPGIWFQMHQVIPGRLNVTGVVVPGQPFVVAGHNDNIAWGMTNLMVDDIDLFREKLDPESPNRYFFNGEWKEMLVKNEIISIKGGGRDTLQLRFTHRGPVVSGFRNVNDATLTMRWSGYDQSDEIRTVYLLNRAEGIDDFRSAISSFRSISQNFVYADKMGNIGLNTGGGIPVRKGKGTIIRNGETDEFDWKGFVPFEQLLFDYNPETGFVSSANNKTADEEYPYYISAGFAMPYRINRIREMLTEKEIFGLDDFKRMITDQHSNYAKLLTPLIIKTLEKADDLTPLEKEIFELLKGWDFLMSADQVTPSVFEFFRMNFARNLLADDLGDLYGDLFGTARDYYIYRIINEGIDDMADDSRTTVVESVDDIIRKSFTDCLEELRSSYGDDISNWGWGNIHRFRLEHPLGTIKLLDIIFGFNSPFYRAGGSSHTVCPYSYGRDFVVDHGASERHIFNTADWDESFTVIPTGASGVPASEFYLSQTRTYVENGFFKDAFTPEAVKKAAKYVMVFKPS